MASASLVTTVILIRHGEVCIDGPRNWLKAAPPAVSAIASCCSSLRPWLFSIGDEIVVSVAIVEVASDAKDVFSTGKLLTKYRAVRIKAARYICFCSFLNHRSAVRFSAPSLPRSNCAATYCRIFGTLAYRMRRHLNNRIPRSNSRLAPALLKVLWRCA